jgi:hypothetical protein
MKIIHCQQGFEVLDVTPRRFRPGQAPVVVEKEDAGYLLIQGRKWDIL